MASDLALLFFVLLTFEYSGRATSQNLKVGSKPMHTVKNATEFLMKHVHKKPGAVTSAEEAILFSQTGSVNPSGANMISEMLADGDSCSPRPSNVVIPLNASDPRAFFYPTCTSVNRCGGCCGSDLLQCSPTQTQRQAVKVMKCRYPENSNSDMFEFEGLVDITMEVHTACECQCRVQAYHCDPAKHTYNADSCSCQCINRQMATQCPSNKNWDEQQCACVCPRITHCLNDEFFNFNTCSCQRGTLSTGTTVDPCATSTVRCRAGWVLAIQANGSCVCRMASRKRRRHVVSEDWINYALHH